MRIRGRQEIRTGAAPRAPVMTAGRSVGLNGARTLGEPQPVATGSWGPTSAGKNLACEIRRTEQDSLLCGGIQDRSRVQRLLRILDEPRFRRGFRKHLEDVPTRVAPPGSIGSKA